MHDKRWDNGGENGERGHTEHLDRPSPHPMGTSPHPMGTHTIAAGLTSGPLDRCVRCGVRCGVRVVPQSYPHIFAIHFFANPGLTQPMGTHTIAGGLTSGPLNRCVRCGALNRCVRCGVSGVASVCSWHVVSQSCWVAPQIPRFWTLLADRRYYPTLPSESRDGTDVVRWRGRIPLPVAGAPTLASESYVENDVTFGGRVSWDSPYRRSSSLIRWGHTQSPNRRGTCLWTGVPGVASVSPQIWLARCVPIVLGSAASP
jgi:hypothetical protein